MLLCFQLSFLKIFIDQNILSCFFMVNFLFLFSEPKVGRPWTGPMVFKT
eukprot:UN24194